MNKEKVCHIAIDTLPSASTNLADIISAFLVPIIAIVGIFIAYQQYKINQQRLRHETYERRLSIYKIVQKYLSEILRYGHTTYDKAMKFNSDASEATFLFDQTVQDKIDEIYTKSVDMAYEHEKMYPADGSNGIPAGDERTEASEKHSTLFKWHTDELKNSRKFFAEKLGLKVA